MEKDQKINCTVESCEHHNCKDNMCKLQAIQVSPMQNVSTMKADESMCSSYKYQNN